MPSHTTELDFHFLREQFPFFKTPKSKEWLFFDNAGGSFACSAVVDRLHRFYIENKVQPYPHNALAAAAVDQMAEGKSVVAEILGVPESTMTIGPSTTQNMNTLAAACVGYVKEGGEFICSEQDHEANIGGWERAAKNARAHFKLWPVNPKTGELEVETLKEIINEKTKVISFTHCSNLVGTINPIKEVVKMAKTVNAKVVVDGVSYAPHLWPDVLDLGVDAYAFSTYKTFGTHQGVLYVKEDFMEELQPQCHYYYKGDTSYHLSSAGHDHASVAALAGLGDFIENMYVHHYGEESRSLKEKATAVAELFYQHEESLCADFLEELNQLPVRIFGKTNMKGRATNIAFLPDKMSAAELTDRLAQKGIAASPSHFDCYRLLKSMGLDPDQGVVRVSFAPYNSKEETRKLISALKNILTEV